VITKCNRVLVTNGEERSVLAACRGLQARGYEVTVLASERLAVSHWSRACAHRVLGPGPSEDAEAFVDAVERIVADDPHDVLIAGSDASLLAVSQSRNRLERHVQIGLPPHDAVRRSVDKRMLPAASRAVGLDSPDTICCDSLAEGVSAATGFGFPVIVKPVRSVLESNGTLEVQESSVADDNAALRRAVARLGVPFLVQRLERPGTTCSFAGVIADRRLLAHLFSRYRRTWPPGAGAASFSETVTPTAELVGQVEAMVASLGWQGIFELELLLLPSGRLAAIDFNPRVYGSLALALAAGVNLPAIWCDWLLGRRPAMALPARSRVAYKREDTELRHAVAALRRHAVRSAVDILRPRRSAAHAYFHAEDPFPLAVRAVVLARKYARRQDGKQ